MFNSQILVESWLFYVCNIFIWFGLLYEHSRYLVHLSCLSNFFLFLPSFLRSFVCSFLPLSLCLSFSFYPMARIIAICSFSSIFPMLLVTFFFFLEKLHFFFFWNNWIVHPRQDTFLCILVTSFKWTTLILDGALGQSFVFSGPFQRGKGGHGKRERCSECPWGPVLDIEWLECLW